MNEHLPELEDFEKVLEAIDARTERDDLTTKSDLGDLDDIQAQIAEALTKVHSSNYGGWARALDHWAGITRDRIEQA